MGEQAKRAAELWKQEQELEEKRREQNRRKERNRTAKKRALAAGEEWTPPKRVKGSEPSTPEPIVTKPCKDKKATMLQLDDKILKEASNLGFTAALENLASRPEVISSKKSGRAVLDALKVSGGLVNPAKRALLGL